MPKNSYIGSLTVLTALFFIWGFITALNDILIPHLKAVFTLSYTQAMLVQFCFFIAYFVISIPSGYLVDKISYKGGIITGLLIASLGCLLFYPAASINSYPLFLTAFFILAAGICLLQVAANPYVTILGSSNTASSRLTLTQAFNSLGTTLAPYLGALFILSSTVKSIEEVQMLNVEQLSSYKIAQVSVVQTPYLVLAAILFGLAVIFAILKLPKLRETEQTSLSLKNNVHVESFKSAWSYKHLVLGALAIFFYVGSEVSIGSFLISFLGETSIGNLSVQDAGRYVSFYWGGAMLGRFTGAFIMQKIKPQNTLLFNALLAMSLVLIVIFSSGSIAMWAILAIGIFNSIMFPTIFSLALKGLGIHTGQGSGILCAAIVGGAVLPVLQGVFADRIGLQNAFFVPALGYLYISYYGWQGYKQIQLN